MGSDDTEYTRQRLLSTRRFFRPIATSQLLVLAGLPLVDGVFAGGLTTGAMSSLVGAAAFGASIFSGAGCLAAASTLEGGVVARLSVVARVYALVLGGALIGAAVLPTLGAFLLPAFPLVSTLVLLGVARCLWQAAMPPSSEKRLERSGLLAAWADAFGALANPQTTLAVGLALSAIYTIRGALAGQVTLTLHVVGLSALGGVVVAISVAAAETTVGAVLGAVLRDRLPRSDLYRGGSLALVCVAASTIDVPFTSALAAAALPGTLAAAAIWRWIALQLRPAAEEMLQDRHPNVNAAVAGLEEPDPVVAPRFIVDFVDHRQWRKHDRVVRQTTDA